MRRSTIVRRARRLLGVPFRLQGRDAKHGLDCVGVVVDAFAIDPRTVSDDYRTTSAARIDQMLSEVGRSFSRCVAPDDHTGRLIVMRLGERLHLAVGSGRSIVHADLRRGCVVEGPIPEGATVLGTYRRRRRAGAKGV